MSLKYEPAWQGGGTAWLDVVLPPGDTEDEGSVSLKSMHLKSMSLKYVYEP